MSLWYPLWELCRIQGRSLCACVPWTVACLAPPFDLENGTLNWPNRNEIDFGFGISLLFANSADLKQVWTNRNSMLSVFSSHVTLTSLASRCLHIRRSCGLLMHVRWFQDLKGKEPLHKREMFPRLGAPGSKRPRFHLAKGVRTTRKA